MEDRYDNQERILKHYTNFEAIKDCFAITRIQNGILNLYKMPNSNKYLEYANGELTQIFNKYPKAFTKD